MSHYGGHLREAFCDWVDAGCPADAVLEVHYEETVWPAERFLKLMQRCSDVLPRDYADELDAGTYGAASRKLLREQPWVVMVEASPFPRPSSALFSLRCSAEVGSCSAEVGSSST
jgi:hypothetical protein